MNKKLRLFIGGVLIVAATAYLVITAIRNTAEYYLTVPEVTVKANQLVGQSLRIAGRVKAGSVNWDPKELKLTFTLIPIPDRTELDGAALEKSKGLQKVSSPVGADGVSSEEIFVVSVGQPKPDMFAEGRDVIVEGELTAPNKVSARQVLTSCPSKYVPSSKN